MSGDLNINRIPKNPADSPAAPSAASHSMSSDSIWVGMTKAQAVEKGTEFEKLFNKVDETPDGVIDKKEYDEYLGKQAEALLRIGNIDEQIDYLVRKFFSAYSENTINVMKNNITKIGEYNFDGWMNWTYYAGEQDFSNLSVEEKRALLLENFETKNNKDRENIDLQDTQGQMITLMQNFYTILMHPSGENGEYTQDDVENLKTVFIMLDRAKYLNDQDKVLAATSVVLSTEDISNGDNIKNAASEEALNMANGRLDSCDDEFIAIFGAAVSPNASAEQLNKVANNSEKGHLLVIGAHVGLDYSLEMGKISEDEYNNKIHSYADNAHNIKNADEVYSYMVEHTTDNNRQDILNTLGSHAYEIENETVRDSALSSIRSSSGYNDEVEQSINQSYISYVNNNSTASGGGYAHGAASSGYVSSPIDTGYDTNNYSQVINTVIQSGNPQIIKEFTDKNLKSLEGLGFVGKSVQEILAKTKSNVQILNQLVELNLLDGELKNIVVSRLEATSVPILMNMFFSASSKTQDFFLQNHLISYTTLAVHATDSQLKDMPEDVQKRVMEMRGTPNAPDWAKKDFNDFA